MEEICKNCGKRFPKEKNKKTCSDLCSEILRKKRLKAYHKNYYNKHVKGSRVLSEETKRKNRDRMKKWRKNRSKKS